MYTISVVARPAEGGIVTGGGSYPKGSLVTVTAEAVTNIAPYRFMHWSENGVFQSASNSYSFWATSDRALVANFALPTFLVQASNNPPAAGTVTGVGWYTHGATNVLRAYPNPGWVFGSWTESGRVVGYAPSITNIVFGDRFLVANYDEANPVHVVTTGTLPEGLAQLTGAGTYTNGQVAIISAPGAVTNVPYVYIFREFQLAGKRVTSQPSFTKLFTTLDSAELHYVAVYDVSTIQPRVTNVIANIPNPVSATTNYLLTLRFDRSMSTNVEPLLVLSNVHSGGTTTLPGGGRWVFGANANDTYQTAPARLSSKEEGTNLLFVSSAEDTLGRTLDRTNVYTVVVDTVAPPVPTLSVTASNSTSVTVDWKSYAAPEDLAGFRLFLSTTNFVSVTGLVPVNGLPASARSYRFGGLELDQPYYVAVVPVDRAGNSAAAVTPLRIVLASTLPPPVEITVTATGADSARVTWLGYDTSGLWGFAGFRLYMSNSNFTSVQGMAPRREFNASTRSALVDGLDRNKTYYFAVVGFNTANRFNPNVSTVAWSDPYAGKIATDLTIGGEGQIVSIYEPITIVENATLVIEPGTTLRFSKGAGIEVQQGRLIALGTPLDPIVLTSERDIDGGAPAAGDWAGVVLGAGAGGSRFSHVFVQYGRGLVINGCS
ncbi:MAG: hypothetical protein N3G20_04350, partial [Verrucomicrobiae bacterium]|nr:hypothetical protein [Verrucomicrobiae bacterium]